LSPTLAVAVAGLLAQLVAYHTPLALSPGALAPSASTTPDVPDDLSGGLARATKLTGNVIALNTQTGDADVLARAYAPVRSELP
jgi:hypothetical protein